MTDARNQTYAEAQAEKRRRVRIFCEMCREFHTFRRAEGATYDPRKNEKESES
jgi:hypothetical protein